MTRKSFIYISLLAASALTLGSCGNDDAEAGPLEEDQWLHPYGASDTDQQLQEGFFSTNNIYLLFNDTLRKEQTSINPDGTPYYDFEAVDLTYVMTGSSDGAERSFSFDYLTSDADKQAAADFVQNKVLPHLGGDLLPFSFLLVDQINYAHSDASTYYVMKVTHPAVYAGWRCTAIATKGVSDMTDAEQTSYCNEILQTVVNSRLSSLPSSTFDEFYSYTNDYYSTYKMYEAAEAFFAVYPTPYDIGLLDNGYYAWYTSGSLIMYNIKAKSYDLADYTTHLFSETEEEFTEKYGQYPIVMAKYKILKEIYESLGVKF